jgi:hypothetical protein
MSEAFPWDTAPRYLLRDRDTSYGQVFRDRVKAMAIKEVVTAARSPWQNPYVERVIGSIRRECLNHIILFDECHLRGVLSSYFQYYHDTARLFYWADAKSSATCFIGPVPQGYIFEQGQGFQGNGAVVLRDGLPDQRRCARHGAPLKTAIRIGRHRALRDFNEGPGLDTPIDQRVDHFGALAAPQKTAGRACIALPIFQVARVRTQRHAPARVDDLAWLDCAIALDSVRGNIKIQIGVTPGIQASDGDPAVTHFILIRVLDLLYAFGLCNQARQVSCPINLLLIRNCVLLHHDSNEIIAELYFREAIINLEPMASMRPTAFERLAIAGHRVRFGQENDVDCLLEQIIFDFRFFQRLVRKQTRAPEDDGN